MGDEHDLICGPLFAGPFMINHKIQIIKDFHSLMGSRVPGVGSAYSGQSSDRRPEIHIDFY